MNLPSWMKYIADILYKSALAILLFFIFLWPVQIIGNSMQDNLANGDLVLTSRFLAFAGRLNRSDIVLCRFHEEDLQVIKRLIGLPGDTVKISMGEVFINGVRLDEAYLNNTYTDGALELTLAADEYFILGDNRSSSYDSRQVGPVSGKDIRAKVLFRLYPFNRMRFI